MSTATTRNIRKIIAGAAAVVAVGVPLALVGPNSAEATTTLNNCSVTPLTPTSQRVLVYRNGVWRYDTRVTFSNRVSCPANRIIRVYDRQLEKDALNSQLVGTSDQTRTFASAGTVTLSTSRWLSAIDTEPGADEFYHGVRFRVASITQLSGWSATENSAIKSV
jgi:hypothetical protein